MNKDLILLLGLVLVILGIVIVVLLIKEARNKKRWYKFECKEHKFILVTKDGKMNFYCPQCGKEMIKSFWV